MLPRCLMIRCYLTRHRICARSCNMPTWLVRSGNPMDGGRLTSMRCLRVPIQRGRHMIPGRTRLPGGCLTISIRHTGLRAIATLISLDRNLSSTWQGVMECRQASWPEGIIYSVMRRHETSMYCSAPDLLTLLAGYRKCRTTCLLAPSRIVVFCSTQS